MVAVTLGYSFYIILVPLQGAENIKDDVVAITLSRLQFKYNHKLYHYRVSTTEMTVLLVQHSSTHPHPHYVFHVVLVLPYYAERRVTDTDAAIPFWSTTAFRNRLL